MVLYIRKIEEYLKQFLKLYGKDIIGQVLVGTLVYFTMMSLNLVNDVDGIWHPSNFIAGDWEISLGRPLQRYADRARFGIVSEAFNSILTLVLIAIGNVLVVKKLDIRNTLYRWIVYIILIANPIVCCSLSYSYMSVNFGLAYFFSVLTFEYIETDINSKRKSIIGVLISAAFLGISMAFYQAYICVTSVLIVSMILKMLTEQENIKCILRYGTSCICTYFLGGVIYLSITKLFLYRADVDLASYKGAGSVNIIHMIKSLPNSIKQCYSQFGTYFLKLKTFSNLEFVEIVLGGLCIIYAIAIIIQCYKIFKNGFIKGIIFILMIGLLPVASCSVLLIAVGNSMTELMSMGMLLTILLLGIVVPDDGKFGFIIKRSYLIVMLLFMWFQLSAVENDQLALKEGKTATITLTENIIHSLCTEYNLDEYKVVAFVGRPADNNTFAKSKAYQMANRYAMFGCWSTDVRNNRVSWSGVTSNFLGVNINFCPDWNYEKIIAFEQVKEMPEYPADGSICIIEDIIVVKVSDNY